jgi:hypothetical protein
MNPVPFVRLIELALEVVLEAMRGQSPAQKEAIWSWYIKDVEAWRKLFKLDE